MNSQWRVFNFFKTEHNVLPLESSWNSIREDIDVTCSACGRGHILFGDSAGNIHKINHSFHVTSFQAFKCTVTHLVQLQSYNILAACGIDEEGINPVIKVYNLDNTNKQGVPFCSRVQKAVPEDNNPSYVSCFAVHESLSAMAVGFDQGSCMVFKGDVTKDRRGNKSIPIQTSSKDIVTGLHFVGSGKEIFLNVTTQNEVFWYNLNDKLLKKTFLSQNNGCEMNCSALTDSTCDYKLAVGGTDKISLFKVKDSSNTDVHFEGKKQMIKYLNGYLVIVYKDKVKLSSSISEFGEKNVVKIVDLKQNMTVYSSLLPQVRHFMFEWGAFYVLSKANSLIRLQEIDIYEKLSKLFSKNQYTLAISIAESQGLGSEGMMEIFKLYGDHLYAKNEFDKSITQYIKTIGNLEPSYIIRKFLDAQQIGNLTLYLQVMHEKGLANEDHTTLLLNCFTKLKDETNLNAFIMKPDCNLHFDVETAIKVCRQAHYFKQALQLAENHQKHKWFLKIVLEDTCEYKKALEYIKKLSFSCIENALNQYGQTLMNSLPLETTDLLIQFSTELSLSSKKSSCKGEDFIHIFQNNSSDMLVKFLEHLTEVEEQPSLFVFNDLLEFYLNKIKREEVSDGSVFDIKDKTLDLLKDLFKKHPKDTERASTLCTLNNFEEGIVFLYESLNSYESLLRYYMQIKSFDKVIETCTMYSENDASLWEKALTYFAQQPNSYDYLQQVLAHIDKQDVIPPLVVIKILSESPCATLGLVKSYLLKRVQGGQNEIDKYQASIDKRKAETEALEKQIHQLKTEATVLQETKCSICNGSLELPTIYFLCGHAFHQTCFESYDVAECPICMEKNRKLTEAIKQQQRMLANPTQMHKDFVKGLKESSDPYQHIASYFSKGIFTSNNTHKPVRKTSKDSSLVVIDDSLEKELLMLQSND